MVQQLGVMTAHAGDLGSVPSTRIRHLTTVYLLPEDPSPSVGTCEHMAHRNACRHTRT